MGLAVSERANAYRYFMKTALFDLENLHGLVKGNVMHVEMSLDQMFFYRPIAELADYRTPIKGLYMTGASMHPGGGVFAASGLNTARTVLSDLKPLNRLWRGISK